ncbi:MAG: TonB-dependent receptor [Hyphomonas sp. BRH_c22]|uniref:TonB-dependent receptor n=1 Tax=Hyphomonas sp. BRH_c22 TaxID=1629710 RepID=UPI0005F1F7C6|nr:TonB-dependent receptor [Hyphomonas sp. BRH_c22]KJS38406.1 MAG: TonB-dependent receptor [Hyphomonas sp. BRH_c22]
MTRKTDSKTVLFASASALAIGLFGQSAWAQDADAPESTRTLATVTVTTQKTEQSIQDVPIAVSAFDEDAINRLQLTGGADLVKAVPNVSFTKGQFTGSNFKVRGIGNDAVAQSSDAGVGIHQNDVPLGMNFLFEQEYFDIERVEVLRGPQGTLYGRNATGGVVNIITRKPVLGEFQADAELTYGNYNTIKGKGMVNLPLGEIAALRVAGALTQRDGYATNTVDGSDIDGRDIWSIRATLGFEPTENFRGWVSWEHFEEDDDRQRSGKQLCKKDPLKTSFAGVPITGLDTLITSLGCQDAPLSESYEKTNSVGNLAGGLAIAAGLLNGDIFTSPLDKDLRHIQSAFSPIYKAEQDLFTLKLEYNVTDALKLTSISSYNETSLVSVQDVNRLVPDIAFNDLSAIPPGLSPQADLYNALFPGGFVADPELGILNTLVSADLSGGPTETVTQELRLQSDFDGKLNFNLGAIYVDGESNDPQDPTSGYYVFSNALTALTQFNNALAQLGSPDAPFGAVVPIATPDGTATLLEGTVAGDSGNYFRSISPYRLTSTAFFGEVYYDITDTLKFTLGLRKTKDEKEQDEIPTFLFTPTAAYPAVQNGDPLVPTGLLEAEFDETTGRIGLDWAPDLSFTNDTLIYGFYSKGYKGGGLNPPQPAGVSLFPLTFEPEFINAYELGTKNTFANNTQSLNATAFFYDYQGYQISQIVNRTAANFNVNAELTGLELEYLWTPADNWLLTANLGLLDTKLIDTDSVDVLDRTNGNPNFVTLKNAQSYSNCVVSAQGYATVLGAIQAGILDNGDSRGLCSGAFAGQEAAFGLGNVTYIDGNGDTQTIGALTPFDGITKDVDGNKLPGAPEMTLNLAAEYTFPSLQDSSWDLTIRGDYYYQADSYSRIFNTAHDELDSWSNVNLAIILNNSENGWAVEAFAKNLTDEEVITGSYIGDDSQGIFTNIFLTEPALYGVTVRKSW